MFSIWNKKKNDPKALGQIIWASLMETIREIDTHFVLFLRSNNVNYTSDELSIQTRGFGPNIFNYYEWSFIWIYTLTGLISRSSHHRIASQIEDGLLETAFSEFKVDKSKLEDIKIIGTKIVVAFSLIDTRFKNQSFDFNGRMTDETKLAFAHVANICAEITLDEAIIISDLDQRGRELLVIELSKQFIIFYRDTGALIASSQSK